MRIKREFESKVKRFVALGAYLAIIYLTSVETSFFESLLKLIFPEFKSVIYPNTKPLDLLMEHLKITMLASAIGIAVGGVLGGIVLFRRFREFREVILDLSTFLQTLPSVAIIGVVVPVIGYGKIPVVIALVAYSILPLVSNIITGAESIPRETVEVARGIGLSEFYVFRYVYLPASLKIIKAAVKNLLVINVAAASLGAIVGAGGFGVPIMAGIHDFNPAYVLQGAIPSAALALFLDEALK